MLILWIGVCLLIVLALVELQLRRRKQPFNYRALTAVSSIPITLIVIGILVELQRPSGFCCSRMGSIMTDHTLRERG